MKSFIVITFSILLTITASGQIDFSGSWKIKDSIMYISGPKYVNALPQEIKVTKTVDSLILEAISDGGKGKVLTDRLGYLLDGKPLVKESENPYKKNIRTLTWDGSRKIMILKLVIYETGSTNDIRLTWTEEWSLYQGILTINKKSIESQHQNWEVTAIYEKKN